METEAELFRTQLRWATTTNVDGEIFDIPLTSRTDSRQKKACLLEYDGRKEGGVEEEGGRSSCVGGKRG